MPKITFEVTVEAPDAGSMSDDKEIENLRECILDALGYPQTVTITAKVISRDANG